jgi:hypothetical protein
MAKFRTHYDSLNVSHNAPAGVIKAAYKVLCQKYHPDKYAGGPEEALRIMKIINSAYAVLSDSSKRAEHDQWIDRQKRAYANNEAHRIMQIVTQNYVPPAATAKKSPFAVCGTIINGFWKNVCSAHAKLRQNSSWIFWLTGIVFLLFTAIILYKPWLETTAVTAPVNRDVDDMLKKARRFAKQGQVEKALPLYLQLAEQGNADAQFNAGLIFANKQDDKQAVGWFAKAAEQGHREAQTKLGFMYATGKGVAQNYNSAVYWCYKAAEQGDVIAQYNLGQMYAKGQGVAKDNNLALSWFSKAAAQGDARAQYSLGTMHANGVGVTKDNAQAEDWYRKAAKQGLNEAVTALKKMDK